MAKFMSIKGVPQLLKKLDRYSKSLEKKFEIGVTKAGTWLLRQSLKIVPVDTGLLRSTGKTTKQGKGFNTIILVSYGPLHYALIQHENLNFRHKKGKSAKFLEMPYRQGIKTIEKIIQDECKKAKFK